MTKKTTRENFRVIVEPLLLESCGYLANLDHKAYSRDAMQTCNDIIGDIKRHVNEVKSVYLCYDEKDVCEFCGSEWEINGDPENPYFELGEPTCCVKAGSEWRQNQKEK